MADAPDRLALAEGSLAVLGNLFKMFYFPFRQSAQILQKTGNPWSVPLVPTSKKSGNLCQGEFFHGLFVVCTDQSIHQSAQEGIVSLPRLTWEFLKRFSRDPVTGQLRQEERA